jgi:beta-1,4-mannosyltransferase
MRVVASPAYSNRHFNPYNALLYDHIRPLVGEVIEFDPKKILSTSAMDILHIHWPDLAIRGATTSGITYAATKYLIRLSICKARGAKLIWTAHNLAPHEAAHHRIQSLFFNGFLRLLDGVIFLSSASRQQALEKYPALRNLPSSIIPHGHYRPMLDSTISRAEARQQLALPPDKFLFLYFGQVRDYKNVPFLIREFLRMKQSRDAALVVAGLPVGDGLRNEIETLAAGRSDAIRLDLRHIPDETLHAYLAACDCVVLPYRQILNSGSVLMALSASRPVIAPGVGSLTEIADQVGDHWLHCYSGELNASHLEQALKSQPQNSSASPDLDPYDWPEIAAQTVGFYRQIAT